MLFDLPGGQQLARMAIEILRLGNDRQSFRWLDEPATKKTEGHSRALLRVVGPPYYSLLRAIDAQGPDTPRAFVERAPRVWVELGYSHPLGEHLKAPPGQMLLLRPPRQWLYLPEAPFRDIYEVLEFALPGSAVGWKEGEVGQRLRVSLALARGGTTEAAELWVLRDNPVNELNNLVQNADDQLLGRLAFAVGEHAGQKTIVLRVRPSKLPPPVLVLKGESVPPLSEAAQPVPAVRLAVASAPAPRHRPQAPGRRSQRAHLAVPGWRREVRSRDAGPRLLSAAVRLDRLHHRTRQGTAPDVGAGRHIRLRFVRLRARTSRRSRRSRRESENEPHPGAARTAAVWSPSRCPSSS